MLHRRQLEDFKKMTPDERLEVSKGLARLCLAFWESNLEPAEIERRWRIWREQHDASDAAMLQGFRDAS